MLFWIITTGEQIPNIDGNNIRKWRSYNLTEKLLEKGHEVIRWSSTFDHSQKTFRYLEDTEIKISDKYIVRLLHGCGYKKNISLKRIKDHAKVADKFMAWGKNSQKPDLILCSFPTIELAEKAVIFGKENNIPVILDIRDLWPDIFLEVLPKIMRIPLRLILSPLFFKTKTALRNATTLIGITESIVKWGYNKNNKKNIDFKSKSFPLGYTPFKYKKKDINIAQFAKIIDKPYNHEISYICFIGSMGKMINFKIINELCELISSKNLKLHLIMCGGGEMLQFLPTSLIESKNITFTGWIGSLEIANILNFSSIGFLPYFEREDFLLSIPNKISEYMSAGLPIVSTLGGEVAKLLEEKSIGFYETKASKIIEKIMVLLNNKDKYLEFSKKSKSEFSLSFDADIIYNNMADYLISFSK